MNDEKQIVEDFRKMSLDEIAKFPQLKRNKVYKKLLELEKMDVATLKNLSLSSLKKEYEKNLETAIEMHSAISLKGVTTKPFFIFSLIKHEMFKFQDNNMKLNNKKIQ